MIRIGQAEDLPAIAALLVDTWQHCYRDFLPASFLDHLSVEKQLARHRKIFQSGVQYLVTDNLDGQLTGFASYGPPRFAEPFSTVELYTLYVDRHHHRQGIGGHLLQGVLEAIDDASGYMSVLVMEKNPFRFFYEKNGFVVADVQAMDLGGVELKNTVYRKKLVE